MVTGSRDSQGATCATCKEDWYSDRGPSKCMGDTGTEQMVQDRQQLRGGTTTKRTKDLGKRLSQ